MLRPVEVLHDRQRVVIRALLLVQGLRVDRHVRGGVIGYGARRITSALIIHLTTAKTVLVKNTAWRVLLGRLDHAISVCFHHFLATARLARHRLPHVAAGAAVPLRLVVAIFTLPIYGGAHAVLLCSTQHVS